MRLPRALTAPFFLTMNPLAFLSACFRRRVALVSCAGVLAVAAGQPARAAAPTATIRGTVSNAATAAHLNHVSVRVKGQPNEYLTERDGSYVIVGLAPGTYDLTVSYLGLDPETRTVSVGPGETARQDFNLTSTIYKLDTIVVAAEVEGNAGILADLRLPFIDRK